MNEELGASPEFEKLIGGRDFLRERVSGLSLEREHCLHHERRIVESEYIEKVGSLELEVFARKTACARIKREIEVITAAANRGEAWDSNAIAAKLDAEFADWERRLAEETRKLEAARNCLSNLMAPEEDAALKQVYRALAKELHPDIHPERHPEMRPLWDRLQRAYERGDIEEMKLVEVLLGDRSFGESEPTLNALRSQIAKLKGLCEKLVRALEEIRRQYPFTLKALLDDPVALDGKKATLKEELFDLSQREEALTAQLNKLREARKA